MKKEKMIVKVNYESGFNFSLLKSRELIEVKEEVIDGKKLVKRKYRVYYDKNKTYKMFKSKILLLKKWGGKMVIYGEVNEKLNVIDFVRWDNNINEVFLSNKKVVKNESEELIEFSNRFEWLENLILNKKYNKVKLIPSN
jgi:hypothetical protein